METGVSENDPRPTSRPAGDTGQEEQVSLAERGPRSTTSTRQIKP